MGTNFYWHDQPCGSCGRFEVIHVGKRFAGWSFGFRGYRHALMNPAHPEWGHDPQSPFGVPVLSRDHWRKVLTDRPGRLVDEYREHIADPIAWLDQLIAPSAEQQRKEDSPEWQGPFGRPLGSDPREWRDGEGFRFYDGDFS
ncbi:hypothetical protein [Micromonospora sp. NBC_00421]|uniref:hypothetical protein n=1 Tax=Micromonospora sp. NBC_00421 TaxID=2975976 RepID=UPI002E1A6CEF